MTKKAIVPALIIGLILSACSVQKSPVTGKKRAYGYSWEQELQIGKEADLQIQQQYGVYDNDELQRYVQEIGQQVLSVSHMRREGTDQKYKNTDFHFRLLDSPVVNAFALPGGYVYVTRGLLAHLGNEAQLAVVLGHEIGHVAARHASQRAFEQQIGQVALIGGAIAGEELLGIPGGNVLNLGSTAAQFLFLQYGRDDERESDRLGVEYAAMQNYDAADGAAFFESLERISEQSGQSIPSFLSTHPDPAERSETIPGLAEQWKEEGYEQNVEDREAYMNAINNIVYGDNPRQGFADSGYFYHPELKFQFPYPDGWNVINQPSMVAVVTPDQDAVMIMQIDSQSGSPRASVAEFLNQEGVNTLDQAGAESNGIPGYEALASGQTEDGQQLGFHVYALEYGGNIYRFLSYTTEERFDSYSSNFEETTSGFQQLNDSDILSIQPVRLEVSQASRSAPFESFLPSDLPMDITPAEIAIVNQVELDETVEEGSYIKIPKQ